MCKNEQNNIEKNTNFSILLQYCLEVIIFYVTLHIVTGCATSCTQLPQASVELKVDELTS